MNQRIRDIAKSKGLTMQQLAEKINIAATSLSRSLSSNPTLETLQKIADALGVHISELFEKKQDKEDNEFKCPNCGASLEIKKK